MSFTIVVAHNVQERFHGFLRSVMLEVDSGVYVGPKLSVPVRERLWSTLCKWSEGFDQTPTQTRGRVLSMFWYDKTAPGNLGIKILGKCPRELVEVDSLYLTKRSPSLT